MHHGRSLLLAVALTACSASTNPSSVELLPANGRESATAVATPALATAPRTTDNTSRPAPPGPTEVVTWLSRAVANESPDEAPVFWTGHAYTVRGVQHYTGFAYFGGNAEPTSTAVLGQVTYLASKDGATWKEVLVEPNIGEVGARGRAYGIDPQRAVVEHAATDGQRLLAIPVDGAIEQGAVPKLYDILVRTPDARWHYAGNVDAGVDDSAGCDEGRAYPCAPVEGMLAFSPSRQRFPDVVVDLRGNGVQSPARERYRYDPATGRYTSSR